MIVVADTSPLSYLVRIECDEVLPKLYRQVVIPHAVHVELLHERAPQAVRLWAATPPVWLDIRSVFPSRDIEFNDIGAGEAEAITLAEELHARLLIDERVGTALAVSRGLHTTGILGVLVAASEEGYVDLAEAIRMLFATNFRISAFARQEFLRRHQIVL